MRISELLSSDFLDFYQVRRGRITVVSQLIRRDSFDIDDDMSQTSFIKEVGHGKLTFVGNKESIEVVAYDDFFKQIKKPVAFVTTHKHCDYLIVSDESMDNFLFVELTSAIGGTYNLRKPILNKKTGAIMYPGGKYQKVEEQLADSLDLLMAVPTIKGKIDGYHRRICLMGYKIIPYDEVEKRITHPFQRYLVVERAETGSDGAIVHNHKIESLGFEYRRISNEATFALHKASENQSEMMEMDD